jgi:hypothetical protein
LVLATDGLCSSCDEAHDALLLMYRMRYGHQVETMTRGEHADIGLGAGDDQRVDASGLQTGVEAGLEPGRGSYWPPTACAAPATRRTTRCC